MLLSDEGHTGVKLLGVPFDATSTYRPGSRFAPHAIREAFLNIEVYSPETSVDLEELTVDDEGDLKRTSSVAELQSSLRTHVSRLLEEGFVPGILGGEHSITFASFSAFPTNTAILVFDAHFDVRDRYDDLDMMHATFLRRIVEERPGLRVIHVGSRAAAREEWEFVGKNNFRVISAEAFADHFPVDDLSAALADVRSVYVSIDLDAIDPCYAPGVANPEVEGISVRDARRVIGALRDKQLLGFDIVELCPPYDPSGITAVAAARLLSELCGFAYLSRRRA